MCPLRKVARVLPAQAASAGPQAPSPSGPGPLKSSSCIIFRESGRKNGPAAAGSGGATGWVPGTINCGR